MNQEPSHFNVSDDNDGLDELLRKATFPAVDPKGIERLRNACRRDSAARVRWRWFWSAAAGIAALIAGGYYWQLRLRDNFEPAGVPIVEHPTQPIDAPEPVRAPHSAPASTAGLTAREHRQDPAPGKTGTAQRQIAKKPVVLRTSSATPFEMVALQASQRQMEQVTKQRRRDELLQQAVTMLTSHPDALTDEFLQPLIAERATNEERLVRSVAALSGARRLAAIRLLGRLGGPRSVGFLVELSRQPETHAAAIDSLCRIAAPAELAQLIPLESSQSLRRDMLAALVKRGDAASLGVYLQFVIAQETQSTALSALDRVPQPPVELFFEFLNRGGDAQRMAAALTLGYIDGPEIARKLIVRVRNNPSQSEALVALLSSPSNEASEFLEAARKDRNLMVAINGAQAHLRTIQTQPRNGSLLQSQHEENHSWPQGEF